MSAKTCVFEGCGRPHNARGYCQTHVSMLRKGVPLRPIRNQADFTDTTARDELGRKRCVRCNIHRPESDFYTLSHTRDGLNSHCKPCMKWGNLLRNFGLTPEGYADILTLQGGGCAICRLQPEETDRRFPVDHDRGCCPGDKSCGLCIRGVLCPGCNSGIGLLRENADIMHAAIKYLEAFR